MPNFEKETFVNIDKKQEALTGANLIIATNPNAFHILDTLTEAYFSNQPPYNEVILPQEFKPKSLEPGGIFHGTHEHAMYFWNVCSYMSGRIKSDLAFQKITEIFDKYPQLFDCQELALTNPETISKLLKDHGLGRQEKVANNWVNNAQRLVERYDGDPRNIFEQTNSYGDCVDLIKNENGNGFLGFREKMTSMILYFLTDEKLIPDSVFPVPVDFHAMRVALATEMIMVEPKNFYRHNGKLEDAIRKLFIDYLEARDITPLNLTNAVWLLSSNLCNQTTGNFTNKTVDERGVTFSHQEMDRSNLNHSENWYSTCGRCALNSFCRYYIPSGPYYAKGAIIPREKTTKSFIKQISLFD